MSTKTAVKATLMQTTKKEILSGLDKALAQYTVAALTKQGDRTLYAPIRSAKEIVWEYTPTVLSPKKFFFPQEEVIVEYDASGKVAARIDAQALVLFGVRPCDLNGIKIMDEAFASSKGDPNYLAKREKSIVIGQDCVDMCDENAFCYKVGSHEATKGFDLMLHELDDAITISIMTDKGQKFVDTYFSAKAGLETALKSFWAKKAKGVEKEPPFKDLEHLPKIFEKNHEHFIWKEEGARCLSCGSCIMVCPTCYCFDVADEMALNLKQGQRLRRWDACMLHSFAEVAGGENFREKPEERLKHRISRKFNYLMKKHGQAVCVGCGRCVRACLAKISPKTIAKVLTGEN